MPGPSFRARAEQPIEYRDRQGRVWRAAEVAQLRVVSPAIDGPNLCLVIRFEREGEERFARWVGGEEWRLLKSLHRLFAEAEAAEGAKTQEPVAAPDTPNETEPPEAPRDMVLRWLTEIGEMGPDELELFEHRTFQQWDRVSLAPIRRAIDRRRRELWG